MKIKKIKERLNKIFDMTLKSVDIILRGDEEVKGKIDAIKNILFQVLDEHEELKDENEKLKKENEDLRKIIKSLERENKTLKSLLREINNELHCRPKVVYREVPVEIEKEIIIEKPVYVTQSDGSLRKALREILKPKIKKKDNEIENNENKTSVGLKTYA